MTAQVQVLSIEGEGYGHWRRQEGPRGPSPPIAGQKRIFFVKIDGLLEPVVLNLSFRVRSNAMFSLHQRDDISVTDITISKIT